MLVQSTYKYTKKTFRSIRSTYKIITYLLIISMMNPNPRKETKRTIGALVVGVACVPQLFFMLYDTRYRLQIKDMDNLFRQLVITCIISYVCIKQILTFIYKDKFLRIINKVTIDYESYNHLPEDYQAIVTETIRKCRRLEVIWASMVGCTAGCFPLMAIALTIYSQFTDEPRKYLSHESFIPLMDERKYETPYYEAITAYQICVVLTIFATYTAFDGMLYLSLLHLSLKVKIYSQKMSHLLDTAYVPTIKAKIADILQDQLDAYKYLKDIQSLHQFWLASSFVAVIIEISMGLSQISTGSENTIIYILFVTAVSANIFIPCYVASDVTASADKVSNALYACRWECLPDAGVRRSICIMMAQSQMPIHFKACGILTVSLEVFLTIMQTAYSMYKLLGSL